MHCPDSRTAVSWIRVMLLSVAVISARPAAAQFSGAIHTTVPDGTTVNGNLYPSKSQVYLTGGPQNLKANGLPDGRYYFQVTDPSGAVLLSNDPAECRQVVVSGGKIAGAFDPVTLSVEPAGTPLDPADCEHSSSVKNPSNGEVPVELGGAFHVCPAGTTTPDIFCDTPNPGGEYKAWLIAQSSAVRDCNPRVNPDQVSLTFDKKCSKTDNFKIVQPPTAHVAVCKFNDANGNGLLDSEELLISGWPITATVPPSSFVTLRSDNQAGTTVTANTDSTGCVSFAVSGIPDDKPVGDMNLDVGLRGQGPVYDRNAPVKHVPVKQAPNKQVTVTLTEGSETGWTQTAPANGVYDASGKPAASGPTTVSGASPSTGLPAEGGIISVNLGPGDSVTAPSFGNTNPQCADCSILGTVTVIKTATPNRLFTWGITKSVDKTEIDTTPGSGATFNYTVNVTHDAGTGSLLTGAITLINSDGSNPSVTLDVTDTVNNGGICTIRDPNSGLYLSQVMNLVLKAFTEVSLPYQCSYPSAPSPTAGTNTATATNAANNSIKFVGTATFDFSKTTAIADGSVTVTDSIGGALGTVSNTDPSPKTFTYAHTFTGDPAGTCTTHNNTASATTNTSGTTTSASQSVKVCVSGGNTAIVTTPSPTSATLGSTAITLRDSAVLSGGTNPTGTITFTLLFNGGATPVDMETVTVNGNGIYTTPTGFTVPVARSSAGTYQWNATYGGDAHNSSVSETNSPSEQVAISAPSQPGIVTTPNPTTAILGTSPITLTDSAVLSGGLNPTGTITFRLVFNGATVDTETVTVNGAGTYKTPSGFTLPIARSSAGTYQWNASYSGDGNNSAVSETNAVSEQVVVSAPPQPAIVTTPNPTSVTLGTNPITLTDSAVLSGGLNPTGTITFRLIFNGATVDTETVTVNGAGTYTTPSGFTLPIARSSAGTYQWNAAYSGDSNNSAVSETNAVSEQVAVSAPPQPTIVTTPNPTTASLGTSAITLRDSAVLSGGLKPSGTITFTLVFNSATIDTETVTVSGAGTYTTPTGFTLPIAKTSAGAYQWNATYSGDGNNNAVSETNAVSEQVAVSNTPTAIVTTPIPIAVLLGVERVTLKDQAVLSGGSNPTGTITFTLLFNGGATPIDTETVTVNGDGTYNTPTGFVLPATGSVTGTYQWNATYSGDTVNSPASDNSDPNERVPVLLAAPAIATTPNPTSTTVGNRLTDVAVLSAGYNPTGTLTFTLSLNGTVVDTETVTVSGNGPYTTPTGFTPTAAGVYQWNAVYSGDNNNNAASDIGDPKEQVVVSP